MGKLTWREIKDFLRETGELAVWALWCPSKLEGKQGSFSFSDALIPFDDKFQPRISSQLFVLMAVLCVPLAGAIVQQGQPVEGWLLPIVLLMAYGVASWFFPAALSIPLVSAVFYQNRREVWAGGISKYAENFPTLPMLLSLFTGVSAGSILLGIMSFIVHRLLKKKQVILARTLFILGNGAGGLIGTWIATNNILVTFFISVTIVLFSLPIRNQLISGDNGGRDLPVFVASAVTGGVVSVALVIGAVILAINLAIILLSTITGVQTGGRVVAVAVCAAIIVLIVVVVAYPVFIAVMVAVVADNGADDRDIATLAAVTILVGTVGTAIVGVVFGATLPLPWLLLLAAIVSLTLAPSRQSLGSVWIAGVLIILTFEQSGLYALAVLPIVGLTYYRIFPDYCFSCLTGILYSLSRGLPREWGVLPNPLHFAHQLPAFRSELLWLPIPNHAVILADAFRQDPAATWPLYQRLQANPLPGFQIPLKQALPQIIADLFITPRTTTDLLQTRTLDHPYLPLLVPEFYASEPTGDNPTPPPSRNPELALIFPRLQSSLTDIANTLNTASIPLRERGLERLQTQLTQLQLQLPGLGIPVKSRPRWEAVLQHWYRLLDLELAEQRQLSQGGELPNPFTFGNPVRIRNIHDRDSLFQGRRAIVDQLYRLILDRNRPTLILHAPRRFGKSSLLVNLPYLLPSDLIPVYIDLQDVGANNSEADFCYSLIRAIHKDTRSQNFPVPPVPPRTHFQANPFGSLEDWLDQALPHIGSDRRILLNLDEFEKIGESIRSGHLSLRLFDQLRHMIQHYDALAFLFSGVQTLDEIGPNWSRYFISIVPIELSYLAPLEADALLTQPIPHFGLHYTDGVVDEIRRLTRCHPLLLQLIGYCLVNQANQFATTTATLSLLHQAIPAAFNNGAPYFINLWTEFTGITPAEVTAGQQILLALAQGQPADLPSPAAQAAHRRLLRFHVIEQTENGDRIEIPLVEQWVRDRAFLPPAE